MGKRFPPKAEAMAPMKARNHQGMVTKRMMPRRMDHAVAGLER